MKKNKLVDNSCKLAKSPHPLSCIDEFILACGWEYIEKDTLSSFSGFRPPEAWREGIISTRGGDGTQLWNRECAARFCIRYHENFGFSM